MKIGISAALVPVTLAQPDRVSGAQRQRVCNQLPSRQRGFVNTFESVLAGPGEDVHQFVRNHSTKCSAEQKIRRFEVISGHDGPHGGGHLIAGDFGKREQTSLGNIGEAQRTTLPKGLRGGAEIASPSEFQQHQVIKRFAGRLTARTPVELDAGSFQNGLCFALHLENRPVGMGSLKVEHDGEIGSRSGDGCQRKHECR